MEKIKDEEKNKKFTSAIKNKMFKGYEKVRNKINPNFDIYENFLKFSYDNNYNFEKIKQKEDKLLYNNINNINNLDIKNFSKIKKDDYNNILNKLFFTTSNVIKNQKYLKNKNSNISLNNDNKYDSLNVNEKSKILNKLFPDIDEINKYSNLPFFYLNKAKIPYNMKVNSNLKKTILKKFPQEEFLYKISHYHDDDEKINFNFIKNKGIKKGRTAKFFHGVDKFCVNNKISETNFYKKDDSQKHLKLKLDISNLTKNEIIPQISTKEKHIKILQNNLKSIKLLPNQLINDLEDGVFKFIDEEFDKKNDEDSIKNIKNEEMNKNIQDEVNKKALSNNSKIINLSTQFQINKNNSINKYLQTENYYQNLTKNKSYYNNSNSINYNSSSFKKPLQYPINFYSTQQLKKKEHFATTHKNTYEERNKKLKKGIHIDRIAKKYISDEIIQNLKELQRKTIINNNYVYKKESKTRDMIIGNKLKCEFTSEDIKRILNGLKPYADVQEIDIDFDILKNYENNEK